MDHFQPLHSERLREFASRIDALLHDAQPLKCTQRSAEYVDQLAALYTDEEIHAAIAAIVSVVEGLNVLRRDEKCALLDVFGERKDRREGEKEKGISREREREEAESTLDWTDWECSTRWENRLKPL